MVGEFLKSIDLKAERPINSSRLSLLFYSTKNLEGSQTKRNAEGLSKIKKKTRRFFIMFEVNRFIEEMKVGDWKE